MNEKLSIIIASSSFTLGRLDTLGMVEKLAKARNQFDLFLVVNGGVIEKSHKKIIDRIRPDEVMERHNLGYDNAMFHAALPRVLDYSHTLFIHDDQWFSDPSWLKRLKQHADQIPADVLGNVLPIRKSKLKIDAPEETESSWRYPLMLQGYAGLYSGRSLQRMWELGGVPHEDRLDRECSFYEDDWTVKLLCAGFAIAQLPPGYEMFLHHKFDFIKEGRSIVRSLVVASLRQWYTESLLRRSMKWKVG